MDRRTLAIMPDSCIVWGSGQCLLHYGAVQPNYPASAGARCVLFSRHGAAVAQHLLDQYATASGLRELALAGSSAEGEARGSGRKERGKCAGLAPSFIMSRASSCWIRCSQCTTASRIVARMAKALW